MSGSLPVWDPGRPGHELLDILKEEVRTKGKPNTARIHEIAELTGTTSAKVRGVIGYYSDLNTDDSTVHVCVGESCRARGSKSIITELENSGEVVGKIHCAGLCTNGPAVIRDNEEGIPISKDGDGLQFFLSMDSLSMSYGAESIAQSLLDQIPKDAALIRTGSRGLFHLEPMLEVLVNEKRIGFGPLDADETLSVVDSITNISHSSHPKYIGEVESLEEFSRQYRSNYNTIKWGDSDKCPNAQNVKKDEIDEMEKIIKDLENKRILFEERGKYFTLALPHNSHY